jgi:chemotaxis protein histidine kinase CheA
VDLARYRLSKVVRVDGDRLDALSDLAGELLGAHLRVRDLVTEFDGLLKSVKGMVAASNGSPGRDRAGISQTDRALGLRRDLARLRRQLIDRTSSSAGLLDNLLDQIRQVRLLPIANLFQLHRSAVRDLARGCGKLVDVRIEGESTLVDRGILDVLSDVLLHLIRNALDHGLESPAERREQSKPEQGLLVLRARTVNDRVEIEIEDDGRGIDPARIAARAVDRGLIGAAQAGGLKSDDIIDLIFRAGFSTAEQTTETSGRGVGMDVVRARLQELGGAIRIDSTPGRGARFSLNLPTSISIARVLLFRVAGQVFGLLATFVDRVERIDPGSLMVTPAGRALLIDDQTIPAMEAAELIRPVGANPQAHRERVPVVVVDHGERRIALLVDALVGERELAIKPFCQLLSDIRAVSGVAVLQDSTLILLLHAGELVQAAGSWAGSSRLRRMEQDLPTVRRVLLVEDSLITRDLEKSILTSFGLEVVDVGDGIEAIEALAQGHFDLVVSDVEMPRMDGLELTRNIKADERTANLPVILITTLGSDEDRRRGLQAGADGYLTKADFGSRTFMELVNRFLG